MIAASQILERDSVTKLEGGSGTVLWQTVTPGSSWRSVTADGSGDVIAAGRIGDDVGDFAVVKLAGGSGAEVWRAEIDGSRSTSWDDDVANSVRGSPRPGSIAQSRWLPL